MNDTIMFLVAGLGMIAVGAMAVILWKRISALPWKWVWIGAGLWALAVFLKVLCALAINQKVIVLLDAWHSRPLLLLGGGLFIGVESSLFEIGLTFAAVLKWRQLGRDGPTAIGIGIGAGAIEAWLLGLLYAATAVISLLDVSSREEMAQQTRVLTETTPLFWLQQPVERGLALLCHTATRSLVLLGVVHRRPAMIFWGWLMFALVDGLAGAFQLTGKIGHISMWWLELAVLPFALASIAILRWCWARWPAATGNPPPSSAG